MPKKIKEKIRKIWCKIFGHSLRINPLGCWCEICGEKFEVKYN